MNAVQLLEVSDRRDMWERRLLDAARSAYLLGYEDGHADARREADRAWGAIPVRKVRDEPTLAETEALRWHVCCPACRMNEQRDGCPDCERKDRRPHCEHRGGCAGCEQRTRETFGDPHPDDYKGGPR